MALRNRQAIDVWRQGRPKVVADFETSHLSQREFAKERMLRLAGLYALIATCEADGVNPVDDLADVLLRVQTHPASRIDEPLPHIWRPPTPGLRDRLR